MNRRNIKIIRIIKRLLEKPNGQWTKYGLAKASGCSRQWVIELLRTLEKAGLVSGTRVTDKMGLVRLGASIAPGPLRVLDCYHQGPVELLKRLGVEYALTTTYAENEVTKHLFKTRCDAYVTEAAMKKLWGIIIKEGLLGKGNLRLMIPTDPDVISEASVVRTIRIVSLGQLMLDLMKEGGVCVQAVEEMVKRDVR
jgi:DNA-binding Lrp family transcriptional regulator